MNQCYKCQRYGHTSRTCKSEFDFFFSCGDNHKSSTCKAGPDKTHCLNCNGQHSSNYFRCPNRRTYANKIINRKKEKIPKLNLSNEQVKDKLSKLNLRKLSTTERLLNIKKQMVHILETLNKISNRHDLDYMQ